MLAAEVPHEVLQWFEDGRDCLVSVADAKAGRQAGPAPKAGRTTDIVATAGTQREHIQGRKSNMHKAKFITMELRNEQRFAAAEKAARARSKELSTTADVVGVSFKGRAFQKLYFQDKFCRRGLLVYRIFQAALSGGGIGGGAGTAAVPSAGPWAAVGAVFARELTVGGSGKRRLAVCSLGGGPGTDAAGIVWANKHFLGFKKGVRADGVGGDGGAVAGAEDGADDDDDDRLPVHVSLLDFEPSWKFYASTLAKIFSPHASVDFDTCDVTVALDEETAAADKTAAAAAAAASTAAAAATAEEEEEAVQDEEVLAAQLAAFYTAKEPSKLGNVPLLLEKFSPPEIAASLWRKYSSLPEGWQRWKPAPMAAAGAGGGRGRGSGKGRGRGSGGGGRGGSAAVAASTAAPAPVQPPPAPASDYSYGAPFTNCAAAEAAAATDLFLCAYVVHETSAAGAAGGWSFWRGLARTCKLGAVLVFADVVGRSAQAFGAVHAAMQESGALAGRAVVRVAAPDATEALHSEVMVLHVVAA
jgi:hypothetical protein